ncbi:ribonuclease H-like domain-containing protein [Tanacetum coccineum]|uniref:Ribonuclease H-like domain-containing protein n=1 Tax=Tanacetum coccineum TaxID=301880 RepID=A0ABQ4XGR9_9ASTR
MQPTPKHQPIAEPILVHQQPAPIPSNTHPTVTHAKDGISKPIDHLSLHTTTTSPILHSHIHALSDPFWHKVMLEVYNALITNKTWVLVPCPANVNIMRSMWLFRHNFNADGSLIRYKARLVANGPNQQLGIDCDETFSSVVKLATIYTVLSLAACRNWLIHQLDMMNAFPHIYLSKTIYMHQLPSFVHPLHLDFFHLQRSLYGLKQAFHAWFQCFASYDTRVDFQHSKTDSSLFIFHRGIDIAYLLLYVDDIFLTASFKDFLQRVVSSLHGEFVMIDLGSLNYFPGVSAQRSTRFIFISGLRAHMQNCNPCQTPIDIDSKLGPDSDFQVCLYMHDPQEPHFSTLKGILRSSAEAEYQGVANVVAETAWIRNLLCELHAPIFTTTLVYYDNVSVIYLSYNLVQHQRTKHIKLDIHFVRDFVAKDLVRVMHVPSRYQYADIFTKGLPNAMFQDFHSSLNV